MKKLALASVFIAAAILFPAACSSPSSPSVSFTNPVGANPLNGTSYRFRDQPVTLTISNAIRTGDAPVSYVVEVASDPNFANKVFTKDKVEEGPDSTSLQIGSLPGGGTYFWHWKAVIDGVTGQPSPTQQFTVGQQVTIATPQISDPQSGGTASGVRPSFTTNNAAVSGPVGKILYEFQVSTSSSFSPMLASDTVEEQPNRTSWTPSVDLPEGALFWRVRALDPANAEASAFTGSAPFTLEPFSLRQAIILNNAPDLASWPETAKITSINFTGDAILVDFDKRTGPGLWPESDFGVQYTLGMCFNLSKQWYCSAVIQFWTGRDLEASGRPNEIGQNWYYDRRWGPMSGHQPSNGESIGIFVGQGNLRDNGGSSLKERSNVVIMPFGGQYVRK